MKKRFLSATIAACILICTVIFSSSESKALINDARYDFYVNMTPNTSDHARYIVPNLYRQDASYINVKTFPLVVNGGVEYFPLDIFALYPYLQVVYSKLTNGFYINNTKNNHYVAFDMDAGTTTTHDAQMLEIEARIYYKTYYVPARKVCEILDMNFETYDDFENGIRAARISDNKAKMTLTELVNAYSPVKITPDETAPDENSADIPSNNGDNSATPGNSNTDTTTSPNNTLTGGETESSGTTTGNKPTLIIKPSTTNPSRPSTNPATGNNAGTSTGNGNTSDVTNDGRTETSTQPTPSNTDKNEASGSPGSNNTGTTPGTVTPNNSGTGTSTPDVINPSQLPSTSVPSTGTAIVVPPEITQNPDTNDSKTEEPEEVTQPADPMKNVANRDMYITFDVTDGEKTVEILDILSANNIKAVFFVDDDTILSMPDSIRRMIAEGHSVGISFDISNGNGGIIDNNTILSRINDANDSLYLVAKFKTRYIRADYTNVTGAVEKLEENRFDEFITANGYEICDWSIDSGDADRYRPAQFESLKDSLAGNNTRSEKSLFVRFGTKPGTLSLFDALIDFTKDYPQFKFMTTDEYTGKVSFIGK